MAGGLTRQPAQPTVGTELGVAFVLIADPQGHVVGLTKAG